MRILRSAYRPSDYVIDSVDLAFELGESETFVTALLEVRRRGGTGPTPPLVLDGEDLELLEIAIDGRPLVQDAYQVEAAELSIFRPPPRFVLKTRVRIHPEANTRLSGLYKSSGTFCTQCVAMGFGRIFAQGVRRQEGVVDVGVDGGGVMDIDDVRPGPGHVHRRVGAVMEPRAEMGRRVDRLERRHQETDAEMPFIAYGHA